MEIKDFITKIPKAELHLHIEGSFEPQLMFEIAKRNGVDIPYQSVDELKQAYEFDCLQDFLDIYYQGANVLLHEVDFYDLTKAYLDRVILDNVKHVEIMFDPQTHTERGVSFDVVINGIKRACSEFEQNHGMTSILIMSFLRHLSEESAFATLKSSLPYKHWIKAVGLDSSEKGNPPSKFQRVFEAAVSEGYIPLAHAGEEGPPEYIWEAIDLLKIHRIDHGNRCLEDDKLVDEIIKRDLALTVCPLSNTALQVVKNMKDHPIKMMLQKGLKATINSDDPAYFGGYMNDNFNAIAQALPLTKDDVYTLVHNSFAYSLLDEETKADYLNKLADFNEKF